MAPAIPPRASDSLRALSLIQGHQAGDSVPPLIFLYLFMNYTPFLIQWNCRSLRANGHWLRSSPVFNALIVCLQETFCQPEDSITLQGMAIYREDRTTSRGGGLLTAVKSSLPSYKINLPTCPAADVESLGVCVFVEHRWCNIINIYSPHGTFPDVWLSDLVSRFGSPIIILGDFNINILPGSPLSTRAHQALDWLSSTDLCLLNMEHPTRSGPNGQQSLLDLTFLSATLLQHFYFYVHPDQYDSDHHPIIVLSSRQFHPPAPIRRPRWGTAAATLNELPAIPGHSYEDLERTFQQVIKDTATFEHRGLRPRCPWWDARCSALLTLKRKFLRLARRTCSQDAWMNYKRYSAQLRRCIKSTSRHYWDSLCQEQCHTGRIFKVLQNLASRDVPSGDNILSNPDPLASTHSQALAFLQHFSKDSCAQPIPHDLSDGDLILDAPFQLSELQAALKSTRPTAPGPDGISAKILKNLAPHHLTALLEQYNAIFDSGNLPPSWKLSTIIPIRKPGKPATCVKSYRPISLTSTLCKLFERMLLRRLLGWGGQRNLFNADHFGFLPTRDCTMALCTFLHDVLAARSQNHFVAAICLDIKAAYDSVCPDILTYKLAQLGIRGKAGLWIHNFIHDRRIQVRWHNVYSPTAPCSHGVPQGSVLSPFVFLLYMQDIIETLEAGTHMIVYADDILIYVTDPREDCARSKLWTTLDRINTWCRANELTIEPSKCSAINFSRRRDPGDPIKLLGVDIPWSNQTKILGIWFTRSLKFTFHFNFLKHKVSRRLNYLKFLTSRSRGITSFHMLRIIHAVIRSCLEYGAPLFFDSPPSAVRILETCYNAAIRLATGLPMWTPLPVLHREAGTSTLTSRLSYLTQLFLLRLLSSPDLRLGEVARSMLVHPHPQWKWWNPLQDLSDLVGCPLLHTLRYVWPPPPVALLLKVSVDKFRFQDTSLPDRAIIAEFHAWLAALPPSSVFATDASKDTSKTSISAVDPFSHISVAGLVPHDISIFSAEALAIQLALTSLPTPHHEIVVLSDSLSVLRALEVWSLRSPTVILHLLGTIHKLNSQGFAVHLIWVPGHRGIPPNEAADCVARLGPFSRTIYKIPPEDIRKHARNAWKVEAEYAWINSEYAHSHTHLQADRSYSRWVSDRSQDVMLARWRSRTLLVCQRLYRMNLSFSPLCSYCYVVEDPDHILLFCPRLRGPRRSLLNALSLQSSATYSDVLTAALSSPRNLVHFLAFSKRAFSDRR